MLVYAIIEIEPFFFIEKWYHSFVFSFFFFSPRNTITEIDLYL